MTDDLSKAPGSPSSTRLMGGIGLALMARNLASARAGYDGMIGTYESEGAFMEKDARAKDGYAEKTTTWWYIRIIDCISLGHRWRDEKEFNSCARCHKVKANRDFRPGEFQSGRPY